MFIYLFINELLIIISKKKNSKMQKEKSMVKNK